MNSVNRIRMPKLTAIVCLGFLGLSGPANAATLIFSEDFSGLTGTLAFSGVSSERWVGNLLSGVTIPGWTLSGTVNGFDHLGDNSVWLNENVTASIERTITGLVPGASYVLSFEYWGDNVPGAYSFDYMINGITTSVNASNVALNSGTFHVETFSFTPVATSTILRFTETTTTTTSPVFDNISIHAVPEPSTLALSFAGIGFMGFSFYSRRRATSV